ncbi:MAG: signal peptidase I [Chloroflexi bacterium RBG_16_47_49]|nr:MAG: signal peptidase I [Chloroflexi bacterium RBG_16_47_49]
MSFLVDILETLILSVVLFVSINMISARIRVDGDSMEPTLVSGEYVIVNRLSYRLGHPQRGDIIVFHFPRDPKEEYIKRVIGLPGDEVNVMNGLVYVNGQSLDENYLDVKMNYTGSWTVPTGQLFVLGDNRNNSSDSHDWGTVPMDYVVGKAVLVYWPPPAWGLIDHVTLANAAH